MAVRVRELTVTAAVVAGACIACSDEAPAPRERIAEDFPRPMTELHIAIGYPDGWMDVVAVVASHVDEGTDASRECGGTLVQVDTLRGAGAAIDTTLEGTPFGFPACLDILVTSEGEARGRVISTGAAFSHARSADIDTVRLAIR